MSVNDAGGTVDGGQAGVLLLQCLMTLDHLNLDSCSLEQVGAVFRYPGSNNSVIKSSPAQVILARVTLTTVTWAGEL